MNIDLPAAIADGTYTSVGMWSAGLAVVFIALPHTTKEVAHARGVDKIVALKNMSVAVPLAVFGALHLFGAKFVTSLVPPYMPGRVFWVYLVGVALIAAAVSIATNVGVQWSGVLLGLMMFMFDAMIHLPGAITHPEMRRLWVIVCREMSFGGAGLLIAAPAWSSSKRASDVLTLIGRICITVAIAFFGIQQLLHPTVMPGVPLDQLMPESIPARALIGYVTGIAMLIATAAIAMSTRARLALASLGGWLLALVVVIYFPLMIQALRDPAIGKQLQGINFFADTLLFAGVVLALASTFTMRGASLRADHR